MVFLSSLYNCINLQSAPGFLQTEMPRMLLETGHHLTNQLNDCTGLRLQHASNLDLNALTFSDYKNTTTAKAYIDIVSHGGGLIFSNFYPGSISDSEITELSAAIDIIEEGHEFMTDEGFAIKDLCATKGVFHNRQPSKFSEQFTQFEASDNFDIASLRIHVKRYIGRVREWENFE